MVEQNVALGSSARQGGAETNSWPLDSLKVSSDQSPLRGYEIVPSAFLPRSFFHGPKRDNPRSKIEQSEHFESLIGRVTQ
jgi:hypothetical protein